MANYNKKISDTNIRIGEVRFTYCHLFEKRKNDDGPEGKYGCCIIWPKSETAITQLINAAVEAAKLKGKSEKWGGKIPANVKSPIRDGDIDREDDDSFAGCYFVNANAGQAPGVCILENGQIVEALGTEDFYSGCYGAATLNLFPYENSGNKGIGVGVNNVIKTRDGERLAGGASAEQDFGDLASDLGCLA